MHRHLFEQARQLATMDRGRPRQVNLRRAVSSAYYGLFHGLIDEACRQILGAGHSDAPFRHVLARAFGHGPMKQACLAFGGGTLKASVAKGLPAPLSIAAGIKDVAAMFFQMQERRNLAEYDRTERFRRSEVLPFIDYAEGALDAFAALPTSSEKKFFLACLLTWPTLAGR